MEHFPRDSGIPCKPGKSARAHIAVAPPHSTVCAGMPLFAGSDVGVFTLRIDQLPVCHFSQGAALEEVRLSCLRIRCPSLVDPCLPLWGRWIGEAETKEVPGRFPATAAYLANRESRRAPTSRSRRLIQRFAPVCRFSRGAMSAFLRYASTNCRYAAFRRKRCVPGNIFLHRMMRWGNRGARERHVPFPGPRRILTGG